MEDRVKLIWDEFNDKLYKYIFSKVNNKYETEDILQDVFIKIYKNIDKINDISKLSSWVYKITKNTITDYYRKRKPLTVEMDQIDRAIEQDDSFSNNMNKEISKCLEQMILDLPQKYQEVIELYDKKGMKHKEISKKLDVSVSCSKMRLQRAKNKLKAILLECCDFNVDVFGNIVDYTQKGNCENCNGKCS